MGLFDDKRNKLAGMLIYSFASTFANSYANVSVKVVRMYINKMDSVGTKVFERMDAVCSCQWHWLFGLPLCSEISNVKPSW